MCRKRISSTGPWVVFFPHGSCFFLFVVRGKLSYREKFPSQHLLPPVSVVEAASGRCYGARKIVQVGFPPQEWQGRLRHFLVPPPEKLRVTFTVKPFEAQARISGCSPRSALKAMPFFLREGADIDMHLICSGHYADHPRSTEAGWQGQSRTKHPRSIRDRLKWQTLPAYEVRKKDLRSELLNIIHVGRFRKLGDLRKFRSL